jgi:hypothetical protein
LVPPASSWQLPLTNRPPHPTHGFCTIWISTENIDICAVEEKVFYVFALLVDETIQSKGIIFLISAGRIYSWKFYFFAFFEFIACHFDGNA